MDLEELVRRPPGQLDRTELQYVLGNLSPEHWKTSRAELLSLASRLMRRGFARDAFDLLPPPESPLDVRVEQIRAFAMLNTGAPRAAAQLLQRLYDSGARDSETLGFLGRAEKDLARLAGSEAQAAAHRERSLGYYREAFDATGDPYPGINAATLSARCGRIDEARALASQVENACAQNPNDYWAWATMGEARLLLGQIDAALEAYRRFAADHRADQSALASSRRQAGELLAALGLDARLLDGVFPVPHVAVFAGHRADAPDRAAPRLPPAQWDTVKAALARELERQDVHIGYASAANGADILFLEALRELGAELHVVLPAEVDAFKRFSVIDHGDAAWAQRFDDVIEGATSLTIASDGVDLSDPEAIVYGNLVTLGLARLKARELAGRLSVMAVWDGEAGGHGSTADTLARSEALGLPITVLSPAGERVAGDVIPQKPLPKPKRETKGLLFADVVGYGQFSERDIELYFGEVLTRIAELCERESCAPVIRETFGDAFYFVTEELTQAAELALALQAVFEDRNRLPAFSRPFKVRIALHAGPVLACHNPVTGRAAFTGRHTSKVARVEPVADDNQILATQQFAALLALTDPGSYELAYAGDRVLPKNYGNERLFVLSRWADR